MNSRAARAVLLRGSSEGGAWLAEADGGGSSHALQAGVGLMCPRDLREVVILIGGGLIVLD